MASFWQNRASTSAIVLLLVCVSQLFLRNVESYTQADEFVKLGRGNANVVLGALKGEVELIRMGVGQGGEYDAWLLPDIGERVFKMGQAWKDFPIWPALHLTIYQGQKAHLDTAFFMMTQTADINEYRLASFPGDTSYGPALIYALGYGRTPTHSHAAMMQRLYISLPEKFNFTRVDEWLTLTGNPPLLHVSAMIGFVDGAFVLTADMHLDVNERDVKGLTALHIAAWQGNLEMMALLLTNGADRLAKDKRERMPIHYAAMRGHGEAINMLFIKPPTASESAMRKMKKEMLSALDKDGRSALMLAALPPSLNTAVRAIRVQMTELQHLPVGRWNRPPHTVPHRNKILDSEEGEEESKKVQGENEYQEEAKELTRGGWRIPPRAEQEAAVAVERSDIDVMSAEKLSRGKFRRDYFSAQRPLLVTDQLMNKQTIWASWHKLVFVERYGNVTLSSGEKCYAEPNAWSLPEIQVTSLRKWVNEYMTTQEAVPIDLVCEEKEGEQVCSSSASSSSSSPKQRDQLQQPWLAYNDRASHHSKEIYDLFMQDYETPEIFQLCGPNDKQPFKMTIGARGTGVPMHAHNASWNLLVTGKKRWFLVAPGQGDNNVASGPPSIKDFHVRSVSEWLMDIAPGLRSKGILAEVTQYPGDVIFIPHGWYHATLNEADTVSVSQEFCTSLVTEQRYIPLGLLVYGGKDEMRGQGRPKVDYKALVSNAPEEKLSRVPSFPM